MKLTVTKLKTVVFIVLAGWSMSSFAQAKTIMYVMKKGEVVFQSEVSDIDNVTFDGYVNYYDLIVDKNSGYPSEKIHLNDIQQLLFYGENLLYAVFKWSGILFINQ